ncbi:MAG: hypothetical protein KGI89_15690 [Euryarchaeota archaeon]|nr:hypothetical protein [Euryarchaeota archaeon]
MSGIALLNAQRVAAAGGAHRDPANMTSTPSSSVSQGPTPHEALSAYVHSEVGDLGYLFGHSPGQGAVPTPIETPTTPVDLPVGTPLGLGLGSSPYTSSPVPTPTTSGFRATPIVYHPGEGYSVGSDGMEGNPPTPVATASSGPVWTFADTLRGELSRLASTFAKLRRRTGGQ